VSLQGAEKTPRTYRGATLALRVGRGLDDLSDRAALNASADVWEDRPALPGRDLLLGSDGCVDDVGHPKLSVGIHHFEGVVDAEDPVWGLQHCRTRTGFTGQRSCDNGRHASVIAGSSVSDTAL
jgi:hypothetical protein